MKIFFSLIVLFFVNNWAISQTNPNDFAKMVDFMPPTPNASSIIKSSILSLNKNTGAPNINIPLAGVDGIKLKVPISINYNSTGIKVDDISGRVGMGWAINSGGLISRTLRGQPDETSTRISPPSALGTNCASFNFLYNATIENGAWDAEPDLFNFNVNGLSGSFIFDDALNPILLTPDKILIEKSFDNTKPWNFKITDKQGIQYYFGGVDATEKSKRTQLCGKSYNILRPNTWYVYKIEHPNGETINFVYSSITYTYETGGTQSIIKTSQNCGQNSTPECVNSMYTEGKLLESITSNFTKADFIYGSRGDIVGDKLLSEIKIYDLNLLTQPIQIFKFYYDIASAGIYNSLYALGQNVTPYLNSVSKKSGLNETLYTHSFIYNSPGGRPPRLAFAQDHWGYFNGVNNLSLLPLQTIPSLITLFPTAQANRDASESSAMRGLLTKVTYPTGGTDEITYESNKYFNGVAEELVGGLRVKKIVSKTYSNDLKPQVKKYYYGPVIDLTKSSLSNYYKPIYYRDYDIKQVDGSFCQQQALHSNSLVSLNNFQNALISYQYVTEGLGENFENGAIETKFDSRPDARGVSILGNEILGAPLSNFSTNSNGNILEETIYKKPENVFIKVEKTENLYFPASTNDHFGYSVNRKYSVNDLPNCELPNPVVGSDIIASFDVTKYGIYSDWIYLKETKKTTYFNNGSFELSSITKYSYENLDNLLVTEVENTDSKLNIITKYFKYPHDYNLTGMKDKNIISPIINYKETIKINNVETLLREVHTDYLPFNNDYLPSEVKESISGATPMTVEGTFTKYDNNSNLLEYIGKDGQVNSIIWGYNYKYPVAKITGASYDLAISKLSITIGALQLLTGNNLLVELNKIRSDLPSTTFVTTYAYKNLIGVTTICDPNNKIVKYEYDNFNRLVLIRDQENKVIRKICYNYSGQIQDCTSAINYEPDWQNTASAIRCQQGSCGNTGFQELEQIDMNPYSSTYNTTKWIDAGYNPSICAASTNIIITSNNIVGVSGYVAKFTNTATNITFNIPIGTGIINIGCLPSGIYTIQIYKPTGITTICDFSIGRNIIAGVDIATFYNISITRNTNIKIDFCY